MANWIVTPATYSIQPNTLIGFNQSVNLTISNAQGSNYILTAENFKIGGASESPTNTWTGGNVDSEVEKVIFTTNSNNTVNAQVVFFPNNQFTASQTIYVDIDENDAKPPVEANQRNVCLEVTWPYSTEVCDGSNAYTYTINDPEGSIAAGTLLDDGTTNGLVRTKHSGLVTVGETTIVADITFSRAGDNYFLGSDEAQATSVAFLNLLEYDGYYSYEITNTIGYIVGSSGEQAITSFNLKISYTPPVEYNTVNESDFCALGHTADLRFGMGEKAQDGSGLITNTINDVSVLGITRARPELDADGGIFTVVVDGTANTQYQIDIISTESLTSGSPGDGASKGGEPFYNSALQVFQDKRVRQTYTTNSLGKGYHYLKLGQVTSDRRYDIGIQAGQSVSLGANVPVLFSKPFTLIQRGVRTITIAPEKVTAASKYGSIPSAQTGGASAEIKRKVKVKYTDDGFIGVPDSNYPVVTTIAKNKASGSTAIPIRDYVGDITPGMFVYTPFNGSVIPHKTKVVRLRKNGRVAVLSNAITGTLNKETEVHFIQNKSDIVPFSFTIQTGGNTLSAVTDPATLRKTIFQAKTVDIKVPVACTNTEAVAFNTGDSDPIAVGAKVSGKGILANTVVSSINRGGSSISLNKIHNIAANTILTFDLTDTEQDPGDVDLLHVQTNVSGTAVVTGYLQIGEIKNDITVPLLIDRAVATT
jgi:hypothetical protein